MSTDRDVVNALRRAAEALIGRRLTDEEAARLLALFNKARGTYRQRANEALRQFAGLTEAGIRKYAAASDNTDRIITDLEIVMDQWKPGT